MRGLRTTAAIAAWVLAATLAGWLWWRNRPAYAPLTGMVTAASHTVGPHEASRVSAVLVQPGQSVRAGEALVLLRTDDLDGALTVARAELAELVSAVEAEAATLTQALRKERIAAQARLAQAKATLAGVRATRAAHMAELKSLTGQLERLEHALRDGLTAVDRVTSLKARERALAQSTALAPGQLRAWKTLTEQVNAAIAAVNDDAISVRLRPLQARTEAQHRRLEQLLIQRAARTLRAPLDGVVASVVHRAGDPVAAGQPVVVLRGTPNQLVAWLGPIAVNALPVGRSVRALARNGKRTLEGTVVRLGPAVERLPEQLWSQPARPAWGRPVYIQLKKAAPDLVAGEPIRLSLDPTIPNGVAVAAPAPSTGPQPLNVPASLLQRTRFEPSGALWLPELGRYLVVSDDTGLKDGANEHAPWVFLVSAEGQVDPKPLVLSGFEAAAGRSTVTDLESLTRAPDGTIWLLCSQSQSRKKKRKKKRQLLIHARLDGSRLRTLGAAPLFHAFKHLPADARTRLGFDARLDIEAMTWADGALLLGLKSPQDDQGRARLLRLDRPERLLAGDVSPTGAQLSLVGSVALPTGPGGEPGGFADLFLSGGHLMATSTLTSDDAARGCAWRIPWPLTGAAAERLRCWPGLKPETITQGPTGLVVFFDSRPPKWAPLP
jgi:multidrug resistance efflux pump